MTQTIPPENPELSWLFSLVDGNRWYVIAFRRVLSDLPDYNKCKHREVEWLWANPKSPDLLVHDMDDRELADITLLRNARPVNMDHAVALVLGGGWHLLSPQETHMPEDIKPAARLLGAQAEQERAQAEQRLRAAVALATPGTEERYTLESELARPPVFQVHDQDIRNFPCLECQADL